MYFCPILLPFKIHFCPFWPQMTSEATLKPQLGKLFYNWLIFDRNSKQTLLYFYWMLPKNPTYTFIQTYTFINFQQKFPPIRLFPPILLLIFEEISHLYFYSDSSSIRNSRVGPYVKIFSKANKICCTIIRQVRVRGLREKGILFSD